MNNHEFMTWLDYHKVRFSGLEAWMSKAENQPEKLFDLWQWALAEIELKQAKQATDLLYLGEEKIPQGFNQHPRTIRQIAKRLQRGDQSSDGMQSATTIVNGQITYGCHVCQDTGRRFVISQACIDRIAEADGDIEKSQLSKGVHCAVACSCGSGEVFTRERRYPMSQVRIPPVPVFDDEKMIEHNPIWSKQQIVDAVLQFDDTRRQSRSFVGSEWPG